MRYAVRAMVLAGLMFLARRILMAWVPVPHLFLTVLLALAMCGALWLIGNGLRRPAGGLRRSYDQYLHERKARR